MENRQDISNQEFERERNYWIARSVIKSMMERGVVTEDEYTEMDAMLLEKYRPVLGRLLVGKALEES